MSNANIDQIELYALRRAGWGTIELADHFGVHRSTMWNHLSELGLTGPNERSDTCAQGHDMDDAIPTKAGGRACRKCKQRRDREYQKRKYWAAKENASE